jgi:hypothetical protein
MDASIVRALISNVAAAGEPMGDGWFRLEPARGQIGLLIKVVDGKITNSSTFNCGPDDAE